MDLDTQMSLRQIAYFAGVDDNVVYRIVSKNKIRGFYTGQNKRNGKSQLLYTPREILPFIKNIDMSKIFRFKVMREYARILIDEALERDEYDLSNETIYDYEERTGRKAEMKVK